MYANGPDGSENLSEDSQHANISGTECCTLNGRRLRPEQCASEKKHCRDPRHVHSVGLKSNVEGDGNGVESKEEERFPPCCMSTATEKLTTAKTPQMSSPGPGLFEPAAPSDMRIPSTRTTPRMKTGRRWWKRGQQSAMWQRERRRTKEAPSPERYPLRIPRKPLTEGL